MQMAFIGYNELEKLIRDNALIDDFKTSNLEGSSYQLTLGDEVYLTGDSDSPGILKKLNESNDTIRIESHQFALLLIHEKIRVPPDKIAFITLKFSEKIKGLINISGFHVDPGFSGKLVYSVYNAGPRTIVMRRGNAYFSIWFSEVNGMVDDNKIYDGQHQNQEAIPIRYIESLEGFNASPNYVAGELRKMEAKVNKFTSKKETVLWALGIFLSLLLAVNIKFYWDWSSYKKGYYDGLDDVKANEKIENVIEKMNLDSIIQKEAESYIKTHSNTSFKSKIDSTEEKIIDQVANQ